MSPLLFLLLLSIITLPSYQYSVMESSNSIEHCQNGRVCTNSCYLNRELIDCNKRNMVKSVLFDPPFGQMVPIVHLRLVRIDSDDMMLNEDVTIEKENLTSFGMNIRFKLLKESNAHVICADWNACSFDSN